MRYFLLPLVGVAFSGLAGQLMAGTANTEPFFPRGKEQPLYLEDVGVSAYAAPEVLTEHAEATGVNTATPAHVQGQPAVQPARATEPVVVQPDFPAIDPVSMATEEIAAALEEGLSQARVQRLPLAVMPFVERPYVQRQNALGERVSESFIHELQGRGFNLVDYRAVSMNTTVKPDMNAKQLSGLRSRFRIYFVLTGTYARYPDGIVINARVLDTTTRQVVASGQSHIENDQLEGMLPGYDPLTAMRKGMIIENGEGPTGLR